MSDYLDREFNVLTSLIRKYGKAAQRRKAAEEAAEFIVAIQHLDDPHRPRPDAETKLIKEVSDLEIMLAQMRLMFPGMNAAVEHQRRITIEKLHAELVTKEEAHAQEEDAILFYTDRNQEPPAQF